MLTTLAVSALMTAQPSMVDICDLLQQPSAYVGAPSSIQAKLMVDLRHYWIHLGSDACRSRFAIPLRYKKDTQAARALDAVIEVMIGAEYKARRRKQAPVTFLSLDGINVDVVGEVFCEVGSVRACVLWLDEMTVTSYPPQFPAEMRPPELKTR